MNKATYLEDKEYYEVQLNAGTYLISGKTYLVENGQSLIKLKYINDIRQVLVTRVISTYTNGEDSIRAEEYSEKLQKLQEPADEDGYFTDIDEEYAYKKFKQKWQPVYKVAETVSEPLTIPVITTVMDTGNPYITNMYLNGESNEDRYRYNRPAALMDIVRNTFTALGMEYKYKVSYNATRNTKIWGNSNESKIRYIVAFGNYVLNDSWDNIRIATGSLEDMKLKYENDKSTLTKIITTQYDLHFGEFNNNKEIVNDIYTNAKSLLKALSTVRTKVSTQSEYRNSLSKAKALLELIPKLMKDE